MRSPPRQPRCLPAAASGARAYTADELQPAAGATAPRPLKVLFLGDGDGTHQSAGLFTALAPVLARHGIQLTHVVHASRGADLAGPRRLRRAAALRRSHRDHAGAGARARRLRRRRQGPRGAQRRHRDVSVFVGRYADLIGARGDAQRIGGVHRGDRSRRPDPILKGLQPFTTTDDTYTFTKQSAAGPHGADGARRETASARRRPGFARRARAACSTPPTARREDLGRSRLPAARRAAASSTRFRTTARKCWDELKMPELEVRGRPQHPELREPQPGAEVPAAVHRRRSR